jgi:quercetin dioxygenase-like cupin family protein
LHRSPTGERVMPNKACNISDIFKDLSRDNGFSKQELADHLGVSRERMDEYASGQLSTPLGVLTKLAKLSGTSVGDILGESDAVPFCLVRGDQRATVSRFGSAEGKSPGYKYEGLGQQKENRQMEPLLVTLYPGQEKNFPLNEHTGEEFVFVLKGRVRVTLNGYTDFLVAGDSIYYNSRLAHNVVCDGENPAQVLAVIYAKDEMIIF